MRIVRVHWLCVSPQGVNGIGELRTSRIVWSAAPSSVKVSDDAPEWLRRFNTADLGRFLALFGMTIL